MVTLKYWQLFEFLFRYIFSSDGELFIWDVRKAKPYMDSLKCLQSKGMGVIQGPK